jgi:hypothetical protein
MHNSTAHSGLWFLVPFDKPFDKLRGASGQAWFSVLTYYAVRNTQYVSRFTQQFH